MTSLLEPERWSVHFHADPDPANRERVNLVCDITDPAGTLLGGYTLNVARAAISTYPEFVPVLRERLLAGAARDIAQARHIRERSFRETGTRP